MLTNRSLVGGISAIGTSGGITIWDTVVASSVGLTANQARGPAVVSENRVTGRLSCRDNQADPYQQRAAPKRPRRDVGPLHGPVADSTEERGRPTPRGISIPGRGPSRSTCSATPYLAWRSQ
jgi:hypothetical protein